MIRPRRRRLPREGPGLGVDGDEGGEESPPPPLPLPPPLLLLLPPPLLPLALLLLRLPGSLGLAEGEGW